MEDYGLDLHASMLLQEYRERYPEFLKLREVAMQKLSEIVNNSDIELNSMESRIKTEKSLVGKLQRKGHKYNCITDITDIFGARIIAFYNEDVDRIAAITETLFEVDWDNSVDKRKMHQFDSFGYNSLHYICRIPKENLLGKQGNGFKIAMHTLDGGRIGIAAQALGLAAGALETTINYVKERKQFGKAIGNFQNTQFQLADMATKVEAARLLVYKAARKKDEYVKDNKVSYSVEAAQAKLCAAEVAMEVTTKAVQLHGGYGYIKEYDVERMMRDAKITEIYEGTSEVQRMVISAALLK